MSLLRYAGPPQRTQTLSRSLTASFTQKGSNLLLHSFEHQVTRRRSVILQRHPRQIPLGCFFGKRDLPYSGKPSFITTQAVLPGTDRHRTLDTVCNSRRNNFRSRRWEFCLCRRNADSKCICQETRLRRFRSTSNGRCDRRLHRNRRGSSSLRRHKFTAVFLNRRFCFIAADVTRHAHVAGDGEVTDGAVLLYQRPLSRREMRHDN